MNILLVNDDGYRAAGIISLAKSLSKDHKVTVVAPLKCSSGMSHAMTFNKSITLQKIECEHYDCYATSGTPADCVKVGLSLMAENPPDLVISGINNQANLGTDVAYSGTASAAMEASLEGLKAIAVSSEIEKDDDFEYISHYFIKNLPFYLKLASKKYCISVNINPPSIGNKGHKIVSLGVRKFCDIYLIRKGDNGLYSYTLIGHPINIENKEDTDVYWYNQGYATITPLFSDASAKARISYLNKKIVDKKREKK
ncbi:MAG: 5'/3'-nucleotidase SurE [Christensenellales bacterium]|nr:5'/3'-nucleotidase SurE [Clostridiales bacterium]